MQHYYLEALVFRERIYYSFYRSTLWTKSLCPSSAVEKCDQNDLNTAYIIKRPARGKTITLSKYNVEWTHIQIDKQSQSTDLDKYLLLEIFKEVAEGVRMQCGQEYLSEDEQDPRAANYTQWLRNDEKTFPLSAI